MNKVFMRYFVLVVYLVGTAGRARSAGTEQVEALARVIEDVTRTPLERQSALARLETRSPERAVEEAEKVLREGDGLLRTRAAWILAESGRQEGIAVLQLIASIPTNEEDVIAIEALGRLRSTEAHPLLRSLLQQELGRAVRPGMPPRVSALVTALADYSDPADTALMAMAVERWLGPDSWVYVEALGRAPGPEAIPVLIKAFRSTSEGMTTVMAGLALARCGWQPGLDFVRSRIDALQADAGQPPDPKARRASEWILERLGTPHDEGFVPSLLRLVEEPAPSDRSKALALAALLRINPTSQRSRMIAVAWRNTNYIDAVRLIALDDEATARQALAQRESRTAPVHAVLDVYLMRTSLDASARDKRKWREIHGYTF